jgi:hypothetical protein
MIGGGQNHFRFRFRLFLPLSFLFFRLPLSFSFRHKNRKKLENDFGKSEIIIFVFIPTLNFTNFVCLTKLMGHNWNTRKWAYSRRGWSSTLTMRQTHGGPWPRGQARRRQRGPGQRCLGDQLVGIRGGRGGACGYVQWRRSAECYILLGLLCWDLVPSCVAIKLKLKLKIFKGYKYLAFLANSICPISQD